VFGSFKRADGLIVLRIAKISPNSAGLQPALVGREDFIQERLPSSLRPMAL
jgi:hypothetical protein